MEASEARPSGETVGASGTLLAGLRSYEERDRPAALEILRRRLRRGDVPYSMHPGEWNWWVDHGDPRLPQPIRLIGDDTLVWRSADGHVAAFTSTAQELARLLVTEPVAPVTGIDMISQHDPDSERVLADADFEPDETDAELAFVQPLAGGLPGVALPAGYAVRSMTGADARSRADAARLSFRSTMEPDMHRARYRRFMTSPAYEPENDLVVIAPDGEVAAFAIVWPDDLGSGQFEPVGTHPGHVREGLGRAVVTAGLHRLRELGMHTARVTTNEPRNAAVALYLACGFHRVDRLRTWVRRDRED